ncbi:MAG: c-type cytochrome [Gammaproteobacteria bacterium]
MKTLVVLTALAATLAAVPASASLELATKSKCMTCHQMDKKALGPSFKDIGAKYKGDATAEATLTNGILKGVKGKWGKVPMPAQKIAPTDAQLLAKWMLTL